MKFSKVYNWKHNALTPRRRFVAASRLAVKKYSLLLAKSQAHYYVHTRPICDHNLDHFNLGQALVL
jgi:hypothetical protein